MIAGDSSVHHYQLNAQPESGQTVSVSSRRGSIQIKARITDRVGPGLVFIPFHYHEAAANALTNDALDPVCKIAEVKVCAVKVEKAVPA